MKFVTQINESFEQRPSAPVDDLLEMNLSAIKEVDNQMKLTKDVLSSFNIKPELNPEIWMDDTLYPEIKQMLIRIAKDFFKSLELPEHIKLKDILFVGSLANFNWSKFSDIDLHLVVDFSQFKEEENVIKKHFDAEKNLWNNKHDIEIKGYPVEIYVQDTNEKLHASAVYSIPHDQWILKPSKDDVRIDKRVIKKKTQRLFDRLRDIKQKYDSKEFKDVVARAEDLKTDIKNMRKAGLEKGGEYSTENLVFKVLRRTDYMEMLDSYKIKAYDQMVTVTEEL